MINAVRAVRAKLAATAKESLHLSVEQSEQKTLSFSFLLQGPHPLEVTVKCFCSVAFSPGLRSND